MTLRWGLEFPGVGVFPQRCRLYEAPFASSAQAGISDDFETTPSQCRRRTAIPPCPFGRRASGDSPDKPSQSKSKLCWRFLPGAPAEMSLPLVLNSSAQAAFSSRLPFVQEWVPICG